MSRFVIESDTHGWLELDTPVSMEFAASVRREFRRISFPPLVGTLFFGEPLEIVDRRPAKPMTRRILIDVSAPPSDFGQQTAARS